MKSKLILASSLAALLLWQGCGTVETYPPAQNWVLYGQVESIRQVARVVQGDPAGGAVSGAIIGGLLGTMLGGRGLGTVAGAAGGAAIGANSSQGGYVGIGLPRVGPLRGWQPAHFRLPRPAPLPPG